MCYWNSSLEVIIMNIVIAGAGKFGKELTENLSKLKHNVTIIDNKSDVIE